MSETRIIKKYPNRRLYDTAISSYITLDDVKNLVKNAIDVKVIDAKTQEDLTHATLLQIIIEQEESGPSLFSTQSLQQMIRFYGGSMQNILSMMIEHGMKSFDEQHAMMQRQYQFSEQTESEPMKLFSDFAQKNLKQWQNLQQQWMSSLTTQFQQNMNQNKE